MLGYSTRFNESIIEPTCIALHDLRVTRCGEHSQAGGFAATEGEVEYKLPGPGTSTLASGSRTSPSQA